MVILVFLCFFLVLEMDVDFLVERVLSMLYVVLCDVLLVSVKTKF